VFLGGLRRWAWVSLPALALLMGLAMPGEAYAQGRGRAAGAGPAPTARAAGPEDLTGYWVSVVTEHWHLRMFVPPKGEYAMLPLNAEARRVAGTWDPAKDQASGNECRSYGAAAIMRVPGRLHIYWADDNTLQVDIDSGTQTRLFRFSSAAPADQALPSGAPNAAAALGREAGLEWQGYSVAAWEGLGGRGRGVAARGSGHLKVTTRRMRPGYLRKNGVPYSEHATLEEHFDTFSEPNGDTWLVITSIVTDPQYLTQPYVTTNHFKKIPDRSGWDPTPCRADQPR
jgi:hypothetical protein